MLQIKLSLLVTRNICKQRDPELCLYKNRFLVLLSKPRYGVAAGASGSGRIGPTRKAQSETRVSLTPACTQGQLRGHSVQRNPNNKSQRCSTRPGPHLSDSGRVRRLRAPAAPRRHRGREGRRAAAGPSRWLLAAAASHPFSLPDAGVRMGRSGIPKTCDELKWKDPSWISRLASRHGRARRGRASAERT